MRKLKLLLMTLALIVGGIGSAWATDHDWSSLLPNPNSARAYWHDGTGICAVEGIRGEIPPGTDIKCGEHYSASKDGHTFDVYREYRVPNGEYTFTVAVMARKENIWGAEGQNATIDSDCKVVVYANGQETAAAATALTFRSVTTTVTNNKLRIGVKSLDGNKANWMAFMAPSLTTTTVSLDAYKAVAGDDFDNYLATATAENPAVFYFPFPNSFSGTPSGWNRSGTSAGNNQKVAIGVENGWENWSGSALGENAKFFKSMAGMPVGKYDFEVLAFGCAQSAQNSKSKDNQCHDFQAFIGASTTNVASNANGNNAAKLTTATGFINQDGALTSDFDFGMQTTAADINWAGFAEPVIIYYGSIANSAENLPADDVTADKWYKFNVAVAGTYVVSFTGTPNVIYTRNGSQLPSSVASTPLTTGNIELETGYIFIKADAATTITITPNAYDYFVDAPDAPAPVLSIPDGSYTQSLTTITYTFTPSTNDTGALFALLDNTAKASLKLSGSQVATGDLSLEGSVLTATFSEVTLSKNSTYTIDIPADVVGYSGKKANVAISSEFHTPAVFDGTYYLYNPASKRFLARGNAYGTAAVADYYGVPFTLTVDNEGYASMVFLDNEKGLFNGGGEDVWCWTDNTAGKYLLTAVEGGYNIKGKDATDGNYLHVSASDNYRVGFKGAATVWQLKTPAERNAVLTAYTTDNYQHIITAASLSTTTDEFESFLTTNYAGKNYTDKVSNAKITNAVGKWTWAGVRGQDNQPAYNNAAEAWNATGSWTQTISSLPKGIYRVTINAFERRANNATSYNLMENGYGNVTSSYLKANDEQVRIKSWSEEVVKNGDEYDPNTMSQAVTAFNNDKYKSEVYTYVDDDGNLTLTIAKPNYIYDCWLLWNNITLTYYTDEVDPTEVATLIGTAEEYLEKPMLATLKAAISDAKTALESSSTIANYNALQSAIENSQTSVDSYAAMKTNYLDRMKALLESTNLYQASLKTSLYDDYLTQYNNGTISNADANALNAYSGEKGTRPVDNLLMPSWKADGNATGSIIYQNTWSTEGANDGTNFLLPFFEYFTDGNKNLETKNITGTMTGLDNGRYEVEIWARVQRRSDADFNSDGNMITMSVNGGSDVSIMNSSNIVGSGTSVMRIDHYKAQGDVTDGTLTLSINVKNGSNVHWLSWKNVNYKKLDVANMVITDAEWATFIAPFDVTIPDGVKAYTVEDINTDGETLAKTEVTTGTIVANTPVLLNGPAGTYPVYGVKAADKNTYKEGALVGVYVSTQPVSDGEYDRFVLQNLESTGLGFYKVSTNAADAPTVGINRAYLEVAKSPVSAKMLSFTDDDETTIIEGIDAANTGEYDIIYNALGIQVESLQKGLNIVVKDGKSYKIYVK